MRHKHADVIHAWAEGEEIEYRLDDDDVWEEIKDPVWAEGNQYRIKPKIVKRQGWAALLPVYSPGHKGFPSCCGLYETEKECREYNGRDAKVIRIEWEEEV